ARVYLEDVDLRAAQGDLHVHQADDAELARDGDGGFLDPGLDVAGYRVGGQRAGRVAGVNSGLLDVLHDAADHGRAGSVGDHVDVELDGVVQELVDEQR